MATLLPVQTVLEVMASVNTAFSKWLPAAQQALRGHNAYEVRLAQAVRDAVLTPDQGSAGHLVNAVLPVHNLRWRDVQLSVENVIVNPCRRQRRQRRRRVWRASSMKQYLV